MSSLDIQKIWSDPGKLEAYHEIVGKIRKIDPNANVPPPTDIRSLQKVVEIHNDLTNKPPAPPDQNQRTAMSAHRLHGRVIELREMARRGGVPLGEMTMPDDMGNQSERLAKLQKLERIIEGRIEYWKTTTPVDRKLDAAIKVIAELAGRVASGEQERSELAGRVCFLETAVSALEQERT